jgi:dTDP-4-dehydrorhamnose 3,5-epimerase
MKILAEPLSGVKVLEPFVHHDLRGDFVKPYHAEDLADLGISLAVKEEFFTTSQKGVVRGMHFQQPPHAHQKLIYCIAGAVLDVFVDLRRASPSFGQSAAVDLSATNRCVLYLPVGFAHGFASLEDSSCLIYKTDAAHVPSADGGIRWDSFDFNWPFEAAIVSDRDKSLPTLEGFDSSF